MWWCHAMQETFFKRMELKLFCKKNKTELLVILDNNRKHYEVQNTRKKAQLCLVFLLHFIYVLLRQRVFNYCLETWVMLFYSLIKKNFK